MLNVIMLRVIMLHVIMLHVIMLHVIMLSAVVLIVMVPLICFNKRVQLLQKSFFKNVLDRTRIGGKDEDRDQFYKKNYGFNFGMFVISQSVCPWQLANLVLCLGVTPKPSRLKHLSGDPLQGRLLALPTNIRPGFYGLPRTSSIESWS